MMSMLWVGRVRVVAGFLTTLAVFLMSPVSSQAKTCELVANSFECLYQAPDRSGLAAKAGIKSRSATKSYRVAAVRQKSKMNDAARFKRVVKPTRKAKRKVKRRSKKAKRYTKKSRKRRVSRRHARKGKRKVRRSRAKRGKGKIRTIGRRYNAKQARRLTRKSAKRGWKSRRKGLGYAAASRGVRTSCFPRKLRALLNKVSAHYGRKLRITSGYRSVGHNRRIGGARRSQHIHCTAADFYIPGVNKMALARYLKRLPGRGGVGTYCGNSTVHLDVGPRRSWHWKCSKKRRYAGKRRSKRRSIRRSTRKKVSKRSARKRYVVAKFRGSKS